MSEFKVITTQEEFEEMIKPRLARANETARKKALEEVAPQLEEAQGWKDKVAELETTIEGTNGKIRELEAQLADAQATAKNFEIDALKARIVMENKLPVEFTDRLRGETAEELQADAETLSGLLQSSNRNYKDLPLANNDDKKVVDAKEAGFTQLLDELKGE